MEIWKDIEGYEDLYEVSDEGNVRNKNTGRILKPNKTHKGYLYVNLCKDGISKHKLIHRLVAQAFIPNPLNLLEVNHIDENKTNNNVENLEFCSRQYNVNYSIHKRSKPINQYTLDGHYVATYKSTNEASRQTGINQGNIVQCCLGNLKSAGGFIWKYV